MRAVIQRVSKASILTGSGHRANIGIGMLVLLGIEENDKEEDIDWLTGKICRLRIFDDEDGIMNLSVKDIDGDILLVSQFTLHASTKKGNRPSYVHAARPEKAIPLYDKFKDSLHNYLGRKPATGIFGDHMEIELVNNGPVTIIIDTKNKE
jgi:D-tyrosyl-tRNA(Tyr) deacylase